MKRLALVGLMAMVTVMAAGCQKDTIGGLEPSREMSTLSDGELTDLCQAVQEKSESQCITQDDVCRLELAGFGGADEAMCQSSMQECLAESDDEFDTPDGCAQSDELYEDCMGLNADVNESEARDLTGCTATVQQVFDCFAGEIDVAFKYYDESLSCTTTPAELEEWEQELEQLADEADKACDIVEELCFGDDDDLEDELS